MSDTSTLELLQTCDLAKQWPNLRAIHDLAMDDLMETNAAAQEEIDKRAEAKAKADAEAAAKVAAAAKAVADKQAAADKAGKPKVIPATGEA